MMRTVIIFTLMLVLLAFSMTTAQDYTTSGWPVEQRCVGEPTAPPEGWRFEGTIFFDSYDGLIAIRAGVESPYYVSSSERDFHALGTVSPDGRWFAVPSGYVIPEISIFDDEYVVEEILIYSTDSPSDPIRIPWQASWRGPSGEPEIWMPSLRWIDNELLVYQRGSWGLSNYEIIIINPFTQETRPHPTKTQELIFQNISPDLTRAIWLGYQSEEIYDFDTGELVASIPGLWAKGTFWMPDASGFAGFLHDASHQWQVAQFSRDGELLDVMFSFQNTSRWAPEMNLQWSSDGGRFALWLITGDSPSDDYLYISDVAQRQIQDTCLDVNNGFAISPTGEQIVYSLYTNHETFVVVTAIDTGSSYIIAHQPGSLLLWRTGW
jgi:hypothetical protein